MLVMVESLVYVDAQGVRITTYSVQPNRVVIASDEAAAIRAGVLSTTVPTAAYSSGGPLVTVYGQAPEVVYVAPQQEVVVFERRYPWNQIANLIPVLEPPTVTLVTAAATTVVVQPPVTIVPSGSTHIWLDAAAPTYISPPVTFVEERRVEYVSPSRVTYYGGPLVGYGYASYAYPFLGVGLSAEFDFRGGGYYDRPYWEVSDRWIELDHYRNTQRNYFGYDHDRDGNHGNGERPNRGERYDRGNPQGGYSGYGGYSGGGRPNGGERYDRGNPRGGYSDHGGYSGGGRPNGGGRHR